MEQPNQKTFCVAPWFQIRNQNDMTKKVCCVIDNKTATAGNTFEHLNQSKNIDIKKNLHKGISDSACNKCWRDEGNGVKSLRQKLNGALLNNKQDLVGSWIQSYFAHKKDWQSDRLLMADVKMGNTCNHACIMCSPDDSSLVYNYWAKDKDNEFVKEVLDQNPTYLEEVKKNNFKNNKYGNFINETIRQNPNLKVLKILGGEPLLDRKLLGYLSALDDSVKKNISILITTNGSIDLNAITKLLGNFKGIYYTVSLEGIGEVQEYARYGSDWKTLQNNLIGFERSDSRNLDITYVAQTATILGFHDLAKWCKENDLPLSMGVVNNPDYLGPNSLPNHIKQMVLKKCTDIKVDVSQNMLSDYESVDVKKMLHNIERSKFNLALHDKFKRYIKWYESSKPDITPLIDIFPELYDLDNQQGLV